MPTLSRDDLHALGYTVGDDGVARRITKQPSALKGVMPDDRGPLAPVSTGEEAPRSRSAHMTTASGQDSNAPVPHPTMYLSAPWRHLVSDNARHGLMRGRIRLTAEYRNALKALRSMFAEWDVFGPFTEAVTVTVTIYEPNASRKRDISNFSKLLHDAMIGTVLVDDAQIQRMTYERGSLDPENPRADITVTLI